ncbi:MAG: hypothetical protein FWD27_06105 [Coriobacteriia bacterium]|nr:hypothetical protein [Coriobacteriia bacterium]
MKRQAAKCAAFGRKHDRRKQSLKCCFCNSRASEGQATVEYLVVGTVLIVVIVALAVLSGRLQEGLFVQHAADSASHAITTNTAGSMGDVLLY